MRLNDIAKQLNVAENFDNFDLQIEVCKFVYSMLSSDYRLDQFTSDDNKIIYDLGTSYYEWDVVEQFTRTPMGHKISCGWKFIGQKSDKEHPKQRFWKAVDPSNIWVVPEMSYSPYKKLECGPYENLTPFHYPISPYNKHCFTNSQFLEQAKDLYKNSLEPKIRELAYNLSYMVADGDILTDKQIGLFKNTYKRFKKGETLNGI